MRAGGETNGTFQAQLYYVFEADDGRVVGLHRNIGERNGKQFDTMRCIVAEVEGGQVKSGVEDFFDLHNWTNSGPEQPTADLGPARPVDAQSDHLAWQWGRTRSPLVAWRA